jgi:O-antigen/teichoic acid export membrane protein
MVVPTIALRWVGEGNAYFINVANVMLLTMLLNTLTAPAYFSNMGTGHARVNAVSQVILAAVNVCAGVAGGTLFAGAGVVAAYSSAVLVGSAYLMWRFFSLHEFAVRELLPQTGLWPAAMTMALALCSMVITRHIQSTPGLIGVCLGGIAVIATIGWRNPARGQLFAFARAGRGRPAIESDAV